MKHKTFFLNTSSIGCTFGHDSGVQELYLVAYPVIIGQEWIERSRDNSPQRRLILMKDLVGK